MSDFSSTHGVLAIPKTQDPLFRRIEEVHAAAGKQYGKILDAGTGGHSLKWLATLPGGAVDCGTSTWTTRTPFEPVSDTAEQTKPMSARSTPSTM